MKALSKVAALFSLALSLSLTAQAQSIHPVISGDFADPSVVRQGKQYFAVGTSSEWAPHFPIYRSANLRDWVQTGYVFDKAPDWTSGSFWAPEYYYHNGTYFLYYTARRKKDNISCIGVATSKYPDRGFEDKGIIIEHGKEAIDAFVYNDEGQLYISYKAYGLDGRPIEILGSKLNNDGITLEGELFTMLKDEKGVGIEGQSILKQDGFYYLFYSAGACCGARCDYNVRVARAKTIQGPYEEYANNPLLQENEEWKCSGHGTFVTDQAGKVFYLYHAYNKSTDVYTGRQGMLAELSWPQKGSWPVLKAISGPQPKSALLRDDFSSKAIANYWQWDFRNSSPKAFLQKGNLHLSGSIKEGNQSGVVFTQRPKEAGFTMQTEVIKPGAAQQGLVIYGDANAALGIATVNGHVEFWMLKNDKRNILASVKLPKETEAVNLKLETGSDRNVRVYWKQGGEWTELHSENPVSIQSLPQWDRSPRIGLNFKGNPDQEAVFSFFELEYRK